VCEWRPRGWTCTLDEYGVLVFRVSMGLPVVLLVDVSLCDEGGCRFCALMEVIFIGPLLIDKCGAFLGRVLGRYCW